MSYAVSASAQLPAGTHSKLPQAMAPFTPFFCEMMYQNLRRALPAGAPESVHWCSFPEAEAAQARPAPASPFSLCAPAGPLHAACNSACWCNLSVYAHLYRW